VNGGHIIDGESDAAMRQVYAHDAVLRMPPDADTGAPGAAVTAALCGHWEHEPPCPLAPHHTGVARAGDSVLLRILFATEPDRADEVRERIDASLAGGDGWQLTGSGCARIRPEERDRARRLLRSR
jgi:hypothetical protein